MKVVVHTWKTYVGQWSFLDIFFFFFLKIRFTLIRICPSIRFSHRIYKTLFDMKFARLIGKNGHQIKTTISLIKKKAWKIAKNAMTITFWWPFVTFLNKLPSMCEELCKNNKWNGSRNKCVISIMTR